MAKSRLHRLTKWMLWVHRYTGFVLSLLFMFWFFSGFVMMYKDFPYLSRAESLQHKSSIPLQKPRLNQEVLGELVFEKNWATIKIAGLLGRPVYQLQNNQGDLACFFADTGEKVAIDEEAAEKVTLQFIENSHSINKVVYMDELDQWTPRTRFIPYLPAFKVHVDDGRGTICYVSSVTGEVFQKLNTSDKVWAWLGAIPHWIYFKNLRIHTQLWRDIVVALSLLGTIMCIAGLYMGVIRVKLKKSNKLAFSPYKKKWFKWHHYTGFVFGLFTFTWILSGLFSMNPWKWSPSNSLNEKELSIWRGGMSIHFDQFIINPFEALGTLNLKEGKREIRELVFTQFDGKPYYKAHFSNGTTSLFCADGYNVDWIDQLSTDVYKEQVLALHPEADNLQITELIDYDAYYYNKDRTKPLPVLKADIHDETNTTYYINPKTTEVLMKYETASRINRWVYHGLHSMDFPMLFFRRPLWDIVVIVLLLGGTSVSITGLALTWKWMKRKVTR